MAWHLPVSISELFCTRTHTHHRRKLQTEHALRARNDSTTHITLLPDTSQIIPAANFTQSTRAFFFILSFLSLTLPRHQYRGHKISHVSIGGVGLGDFHRPLSPSPGSRSPKCAPDFIFTTHFFFASLPASFNYFVPKQRIRVKEGHKKKSLGKMSKTDALQTRSGFFSSLH